VPSESGQTPPALERPRELPRSLLPDVVRRRAPVLLTLDYDGTLSPIVSDPARAVPAPGATQALARLARHPKALALAVISGRDIDQLRRLLGVDFGLTMLGVHGAEILEADGSRRLIEDLGGVPNALDKVREWLRANVPEQAGFVVEDKRLSVALHYRNAEAKAAERFKLAFESFVAAQGPQLRLGRGKMVVEAMPRGADKGRAIRFLRARFRFDAPAVYFGDDITDEDAFYALRDGGITVRVGDSAPSWAKFRVASPTEVVETLTAVADALERRRTVD
jgi:trehalose 6-phosphate phosphatase